VGLRDLLAGALRRGHDAGASASSVVVFRSTRASWSGITPLRIESTAAMSDAPQIRRADKLMSDERVRELLARGFSGRLATVGADGWPYVVPLLYVWLNDEVWVHNSRGHGHLRANVDHADKACFELDEPGAIFPYGRSSVTPRSRTAA
jgi:hypothetical protein